jgi:hypothetical protein
MESLIQDVGYATRTLARDRAFIPARRATRVPPMQALRCAPSSLDRHRRVPAPWSYGHGVALASKQLRHSVTPAALTIASGAA